MKIKFPNPDEYDDDFGMFFEQLELCIHHARKSWEKIKDKEPFVSFRVEVLSNDYDKYAEILDERKEQEISIEINTP